jgi:hypothetical protein
VPVENSLRLARALEEHKVFVAPCVLCTCVCVCVCWRASGGPACPSERPLYLTHVLV